MAKRQYKRTHFYSIAGMLTDEEALSEKILDDLFYVPLIDKLSTDDDFENDCFDEIVKDAEEALANESEIKSLNFR